MNVLQSLALAAVLGLPAVPAAAAAPSEAAVSGNQTTVKVAIVDMRLQELAVALARAAEMSREGVVLVSEGIEQERAATLVRATASDAIVHGYGFKGLVMAAPGAEAVVRVYGLEGAQFGPAIPAGSSLDGEVTARVRELAARRGGGTKLASAVPTDSSRGQDEVRCRSDRVLGSRVSKKRICTSDKSERSQREAVQNTQDRGAPNNDDLMGGG